MFSLAEKESITVYVNLRVYVAVSIWVQRIWILTTAIFPRALPAAALVDVRPEVVLEGAKPSVVCFALAGDLLVAEAFFPVFLLLLDSFGRDCNRREIEYEPRCSCAASPRR